MKIDIHSHIVERRYVDALIADLALQAEKTSSGQTLFRRNGYTFLWERPDMFDIDGRLRKMDEQGVDMRVLSLSTPTAVGRGRNRSPSEVRERRRGCR